MATELRKTGLSVVGDVPWGTHFCTFYETKQDLLDILVPFFKTGLENKEFCLWIISNSELLTIEEATNALRSVRVDLDSDLSEGKIELVRHDQWFLDGEGFDIQRVAYRFEEKLKHALADGYAGMRVNGSPAWLYKYDDKELVNFERRVDELYPDLRIIASCTYPIPKSDAGVLLDVAEAHRFVITRRRGNWEILETPELIQAKAEIVRLNAELEQRVIERTKKLEATSARLRAELDERKTREAELRRMSRALRLISGSNLTLVRLTDEATVLGEVCRIAVEVGGYKMAWIGFAEQDERKTVRPVAYAGFEGGYLESINVTWADEPHGRGPGGTAIRTGEPSVARNIHEDPFFGPWRAVALRLGFRSSIALPLRGEDRTFGFLAIYAEEPDAFDAGEVRILSELASDLAFGLAVLRARAARKRAEEALEESRRKLEEAQRLANIGYWESDLLADSLPITLSEETRRLLGETRRVLGQAEFREMVHPDDRQLERTTFDEMLQTGRPYDAEYRIIRRDGEIRFIHAWDEITYDENRRPIRMFGTVQDITERKRVEEELKESQRKLALAQRIAHVGHWERDLDTNLIIWSDEIYRIFGLPRRENDSPLTEWRHMLHPEDRERVSLAIDEAQRGGRRYDVEYRIMRPDGEVRYVHSHGDVIRDEQGRPRRAFGVAQDITERKRAEEALRESQKQYETLVNTIDGIVWEVEADTFRFTFVSKHAEQILGYPVSQWHNEPDFWANHLYPDDRDWAVGFCVDASQRRVDHQLEYRMLAADGRVVWLRDHVTVNVRDDNSVCLRGVMVDITERKHAEEQLKASTAQLRALSARLQSAREEEGTRIAREIHDELGGALTGLKWDLEHIDKILAGAENGGKIHSVQQKIPTMTGLVDTTINTVRRISSELRPGVLDNLGLVAAIDWHAQQFQERTGIICRVDSLIDQVDLNREQVTAVFRIFQEAMTNVLRHAQATKVNIIIEEDEGEFIVEIKDNGRGITEAERLGIHSLGLVGMRERANSVGGKVKIHGVAGKGTTVIVRLSIKGGHHTLR